MQGAEEGRRYMVSTKEKATAAKKNTTVDIQTLNEKYAKRWNFIIFSLIFMFVVLSLLVAHIIGAHGVENPYETKIIQVSSEAKEWHQNDNINLFKTRNRKGEKVIWPGQSGSYDFVVQNNNNDPITYQLSLDEANRDNINMKYRLKLNNVYVVGDEKTYESIDKVKLDNITILGKGKSLFTLEWTWEKADNDAKIVREGLATYRIYIDVYSKVIGKSLLQ